MDYFKYKKNKLYCENVAVGRIAEKLGTPCYIYSENAFREQYRTLKSAFTKLKPLICYSVKACSNLAILRLLVREGAGLDIVSGGELFRAKKAGAQMSKIVYASVGKTTAEIEDAIRSGIHFFNVESEPELVRINDIAGRLKKRAKAALRLNPDIESHTHHYITTAKKENKFGIDFATAQRIFSHAPQYHNVAVTGIHLHIGSQLTKLSPFVHALEKTLAFLDKAGLSQWITTVNLGGGVGIRYHEETELVDLRQYAAAIEKILVPRGCDLILEPGRFMSGNSAIFVTEVQYIKDSHGKKFAIVDGAMNDLIRPSLYDAFHEIVPVVKKARAEKHVYDVVGPVCESGDFFAKGRLLPELTAGDLVALKSAGAYGFAMSSNYNSRRRAVEVLVKGSSAAVIRKRETLQDIINGEIVPTHLK